MRGRKKTRTSASTGYSSQHHDQSRNEQLPPYECIVGAGLFNRDGKIDLDLDLKSDISLESNVWTPSQSNVSEANLSSRLLAMNIVVQVVGNRRDVEPFVALGNSMKMSGHRVRIATHGAFEDLVRSSGLEFYDVGGAALALVCYSPNQARQTPLSIDHGDEGMEKKEEVIMEILDGCWKACIAPDTITGMPFVADAIVASPAGFAYFHCAQALKIPVHVMSSTPRTPTRSFAHPLAKLSQSGSSGAESVSNYLSYSVIECIAGQTIYGLINGWRNTLGLQSIDVLEATFLRQRFRIPHTYCWSERLLPKPRDWPCHVDVRGFWSQNEPDYNPGSALTQFLARGPSPVFICISCVSTPGMMDVVDSISAAISATGTRAIIPRAYVPKDIKNFESNPNIFLIEDCPKEWLCRKVSAIVHHGGMDMTALALRYARPSVIVPLFGDQTFWGHKLNAAGASPPPIPHSALNASKLTAALRFCFSWQAKEDAEKIAAIVEEEAGIEGAIQSFEQNLPIDRIHCHLIPGMPASWIYTSSNKQTICLSKLAAQILIEHARIDAAELQRNDLQPSRILNRELDPISASVKGVLSVAMAAITAAASIFTEPYKAGVRALAADDQSMTARKNTLTTVGNVGGALENVVKSAAVDIPLAVAEGFRNAPRLHGEEVPVLEAITDWKSGATVAGKSFAYGLFDGVSGIVTQPYHGAKREGPLGLVKGFGRGIMGVAWKPAAAATGLVGYSIQGVYQSAFKALHSSTEKDIVEGLHAEGKYLFDMAVEDGSVDFDSIICAFVAAV